MFSPALLTKHVGNSDQQAEAYREQVLQFDSHVFLQSGVTSMDLLPKSLFRMLADIETSSTSRASQNVLGLTGACCTECFFFLFVCCDCPLWYGLHLNAWDAFPVCPSLLNPAGIARGCFSSQTA